MNQKTLIELFNNKSGVGLLVLFIVSGILIYLSTTLNEENYDLKILLLSTGTSLIATTLFTFFYNLLTYNITNRVLEQTIAEKLTHSKDEILSGFGSFYMEYIPSMIFEAVNSSSTNFDDDLKSEIELSDNYYFRGTSGIRTAMRIESTKGKIQYLRMNLLNPVDDEALRERANLILSIEKKPQTQENTKRIIDIVKKEILSSVIGLFYYCKTKCYDTQIVFQKGISISRLEILDNAFYLSLYDDGNVRYPETLKFTKNTKLYKILAQEGQKEFDDLSSEFRIKISGSMKESDLLKQFNEIGLELNNDKLIEFKTHYELLRNKYLNNEDIYSIPHQILTHNDAQILKEAKQNSIKI